MYMGGLVLENIVFPATSEPIVMSVQLKLKEHNFNYDFNYADNSTAQNSFSPVHWLIFTCLCGTEAVSHDSTYMYSTL